MIIWTEGPRLINQELQGSLRIKKTLRLSSIAEKSRILWIGSVG